MPVGVVPSAPFQQLDESDPLALWDSQDSETDGFTVFSQYSASSSGRCGFAPCGHVQPFLNFVLGFEPLPKATRPVVGTLAFEHGPFWLSRLGRFEYSGAVGDQSVAWAAPRERTATSRSSRTRLRAAQGAGRGGRVGGCRRRRR